MSIWHAASPATSRLAWRICSGSIRGAAGAGAGVGVGVAGVGVGVAAAAAATVGGGVVVGVAAAAAAVVGVVVGGAGVGVGAVEVVVAASLSRSSAALCASRRRELHAAPGNKPHADPTRIRRRDAGGLFFVIHAHRIDFGLRICPCVSGYMQYADTA